ncbi:hypothetical protein WJX74_008454 [Apatococcus lobatus]|uniref:Mitochondrial-processing peptidase subunit alpha n=1 Tax=Apatococcus lobatus TaxID=904363 RepID=A0AAW1SEL4_9CHLO
MLRKGLERNAQPLAVQLRASFSSSVTAGAGNLALVGDAQQQSGGFLSRLFGAPQRITTPLTEPLPGLDYPSPATQPTSPPETQITTLPNGLKVASEATPGLTATLGVYVNSGSVWEMPHESGASNLLEYMAYKTTSNRTHFRLVREVESMGGNVLASATREQMAYNIDVVKTNIPEALEVLLDAVANPAFHNWELQEQIKRLTKDIENAKNNPQSLLMEGCHAAAYSGALGQPLIAPLATLPGLSTELMHSFVARNYNPTRMVLAGSGIEHDALVSLAEPMVAGLSGGHSQSSQTQPPSEYTGGDFRQLAAGPITNMMLMFEFNGGWRDVKGSVAVTVLQYLLGGGGSFSAGGPGKGMHSRLYLRVLSGNPWVHHCGAINNMYNDTGLVGIMATCESGQSDNMVGLLVKEFQALTKDVPGHELERAKRAATASILMNLESRAIVVEDIGRQLLTYDRRIPVDEFLTAIEALQPSDITSLVTELLKKPPTFGAIGDISKVPRYQQVAAHFG